MKITLLGTGVAIPQHERFQSGLIVEAGSGPVLFDCGCGVLQRIYRSGYKHTEISSVLLSHLHLDHCGDFLALAKANWLCGAERMHLYGPGGTAAWLENLMAAFPYLQDKIDITVGELSPGDILNVQGLRVECIRTAHSLPSLGFRVSASGKIMLYTGDTEPSARVAEASRGVDLLIHECSFPDTFDVTNHTTPGKLAELLGSISVGRIVLTHLYPQTQGFESEMVWVLEAACRCPVEIGFDNQVIDI